ncbi:MAG: bifunctional phosphoribosyl-AMP cyclohydrolase/phosphoribosyl-ATP diphosphatase HisIE [Oscillospiraceae bacterium]|nr:bifunctional phosphoribosyl-AMP cyclohydrolase/phosphoribosyl-ATP diphosphatase HisIE [Oscillospiraceae bacterium]
MGYQLKFEGNIMVIDELKFDSRGLIPAVVQDFRTGRVLTVAYMNRESLDVSIRERHTCFYSRSRGELWRKGGTSGHVQRIVSIQADCDGDALLVRVDPSGPACHTGAESCFQALIYDAPEDADGPDAFSIEKLYGLIDERRSSPKERSYTSYLFEKGLDKILKKLSEETAEVVIAAKNRSAPELTYELADLCYHALVLMSHEGCAIDDVRRELAMRHTKKAGDEFTPRSGERVEVKG